MAQAAQQIDHAASTIDGLRKSLREHHAAILTGWQGNAARAFTQAFGEFDAGLGKVLNGGDGKKGLDDIHQALVHNRIQYEASEQEQADAANAIHQFINN